MSSLATAFVAIVPSMEGFENKLKKELSKPLEKAGEEGGQKSGSIFGSVFKGLATVAAIGAGAAIAGLGATMTAGFGRLQNIERARNLLQGVGNDAETVDQVMSDALASVKGTAFGLDEAALVAANAVASGVQPGKDLERQLKLVADVASVTGSSMGDIGDIMAKVNTTNKVTNRELQQLATRGVPVYQYLAETIGVTGEEIQSMAADGKISLEMLEDALENNLGGAALKAGETTAGAFANVQASLSRVGANLLEGVFGELPNFFGSIIEALGPLEEVAKEVGAELAAAMIPAMQTLVDLLPDLLEAIIPILPSLAELLAAVIELAVAVLPVAVEILGFFIEKLTQLITWVTENKGLAMAWGVALGILAIAIKSVGLVTFIKDVIKAAVVVGKLILQLGFKTIMLIGQAVHMAVNTAATIAMTVATKAATLATKAFNLALKMNPIGIVITAVVALIAALVWFFTKTETGRALFEKFTGALRKGWETIKLAFQIVKKALGDFVGEWIRRFNIVREFFGKVVSAIPEAFTKLVERLKTIGKNIISGLLNGLKNAFTAVTDWIRGAAERVAGPFARLLGISSPSKVFMEFGENIGEGLVLGLESMEPAVESEITSLVKIPDTPDMSDLSAQQSVVNYYAAPNQSLDAEQELMKAMKRARLVAQW